MERGGNMALIDKIGFQGQINATNTDLYTVPASTKARLVGAVFTNVDSSEHYFTLYFVKSGDTAADDTVFYAKDIVLQGADGANSASGGYWEWSGGLPMNAGDKMVAIADTGVVITATLVVVEEAI